MRQVPMRVVLALVGIVLLAGGCDQPKKSAPAADKQKIAPFLLTVEPQKYDIPVNVDLDGKIQVLGVDYEPKPLAHGKPYTITFYYKVLDRIGEDFKFFGHFEPESGPAFRAPMDHYALSGKYPTSQWEKGEILKDVYRGSRLPREFPGKSGVLWGGFFKEKDGKRMPVHASSKDKTDADGRAKLAILPLDDPQEVKRELTAYRAKEKIKIDGKADEKAWANAATTGAFSNVSGERVVEPRTETKVLWDDENIYVLFICEDKDIWTNLTKRDEDLFKEETTEIMIDASGDQKTYYEIQVNAANALLDIYWPERRKGDDRAWDSKLKSAVYVEGSLNKRGDEDKRWTVEIAIPFASIADAANKPPKAGDKWRMNFYRMEKPTEKSTVGSMWSPTFVGDYHTLDRFGWVLFSDKNSEERADVKIVDPTKGRENLIPIPAPKKDDKNGKNGAH